MWKDRREKRGPVWFGLNHRAHTNTQVCSLISSVAGRSEVLTETHFHWKPRPHEESSEGPDEHRRAVREHEQGRQRNDSKRAYFNPPVTFRVNLTPFNV